MASRAVIEVVKADRKRAIGTDQLRNRRRIACDAAGMESVTARRTPKAPGPGSLDSNPGCA